MNDAPSPSWPEELKDEYAEYCRLDDLFPDWSYKDKAYLKGMYHKALKRLADYALRTEAEPAQDSWRCFWCAEVFTNEDEAREHFGTQEGEICACKLTKDEKGLVGLLRDAWKRLDEFYSENDAQTKEFYALGAAHSTALRTTEEAGYEKGLADGRSLPPAATPTDAELEEIEKRHRELQRLGERSGFTMLAFNVLVDELAEAHHHRAALLHRLKASAPVDAEQLAKWLYGKCARSGIGPAKSWAEASEEARQHWRGESVALIKFKASAPAGRMPTREDAITRQQIIDKLESSGHIRWGTYSSACVSDVADAILDLIGRTK